jgi:hypothetical protein
MTNLQSFYKKIDNYFTKKHRITLQIYPKALLLSCILHPEWQLPGLAIPHDRPDRELRSFSGQ